MNLPSLARLKKAVVIATKIEKIQRELESIVGEAGARRQKAPKTGGPGKDRRRPEKKMGKAEAPEEGGMISTGSPFPSGG